MRRLLLPSLALLALLVLVPAAPADARCKNANARPGTISSAAHSRAVRCLIGQVRASKGARRLRRDGRLTKAARAQAVDMVVRDFFGHVSPTGRSFSQRIQIAGYRRSAKRWSVGETLAFGTGRRGTPRRLVRSWLSSPAHRAALLSRSWKHIGVSVVLGSPRGKQRGAATAAVAYGRRG